MCTEYILNHFYRLRHDIKRSYIVAPDYIEEEQASFVQKNWMSRIHPIFAMALSFFSEPSTLAFLKEQFSHFFNISESQAETFIELFLDNQENFKITYENENFYFPKNIIIKVSDQFVKPISYSPEQFSYDELDLKRERFYVAPQTIVFMVNNKCITDCAYCYADKSVNYNPISFDKLKDVVEEARELCVTKFSLVGGEIFLYKYWKELLDLLQKNNLRETLISTKIPITENDIIEVKKRGVHVQISLDTLDSDKLQKILNVNAGYADKIQNTILLLDKHAVPFQVSTVLTKYNSTTENLESLHKFLNQTKYLERWEIRVAFKSLYSRKNFELIKITRNEIDKIDKWIRKMKQKQTMYISWAPDEGNKYFKEKKGSRHFAGPRCSANYSNLFILPDGKVGICEQLYWNPRFLIGDLTIQTITEVWNSQRALSLSSLTRKDFRSCSACKTCDIFDTCIAFPNRCYADILKGYGIDNWDYPDPRCYKAPKFTHNLLNE